MMKNNKIFTTVFCVSLAVFAGCDSGTTLKTDSGKTISIPAYQEPPATKKAVMGKVRMAEVCPETIDAQWREAQVIEGVKIAASKLCSPDNPFDIATFVKGTNNVSMATLMQTQLSPDTVTKTDDLDGDGDPDVIRIRLEVAELNGRDPDLGTPFPAYDIAPGVQPGFWVFAPKTRGMVVASNETTYANPYIRMPSPAIRVEQGDRIELILENTHYFPHTIHLHGVDHPYMQEDGKGNDGVPQTFPTPEGAVVLPGQSYTYKFQPRNTGTMVYHCHVQTGSHILMGLIGMLIIEENRPNNWVQTFNVGDGHVRHSSVAVKEDYDREYDLHYIGSDKELHNIIQQYNDPRLIAEAMNQHYRLSDRKAEYFTLNGKSFPYTLAESLIIVAPDEKIKLRMFNGGEDTVAIHTHGHKAKITHYDGVEHNPIAQIRRDIYNLEGAQRNDLELDTHNDGVRSYGEGVWLFHDHNEYGITTDSAMPGGNVSIIAYESFLTENGLPRVNGTDLTKFFTDEYYDRSYPVWGTLENADKFGIVDRD